MYLLCTVLLLNSCSSAPEKTNTVQDTVPKETAKHIDTVEIIYMKFIPDSITVNKGDEVVFINKDMVAHCVTEETSKAWTSSALPAGGSYVLVADKSSNYYCAIHQVMKGKIIVR